MVDTSDASRRITAIESGGRYDALGPVVNKSGSRAHGKYQVMDFNIGPWTEQHFGQRLTPQEFLANPEAQEAVFKGEFGRLSQKYGSDEAAARAWFAGEGGMNNMNATDALGTSVADYSKKFTGLPGTTTATAYAMAPTQNVSGAPLPAMMQDEGAIENNRLLGLGQSAAQAAVNSAGVAPAGGAVAGAQKPFSLDGSVRNGLALMSASTPQAAPMQPLAPSPDTRRPQQQVSLMESVFGKRNPYNLFG